VKKCLLIVIALTAAATGLARFARAQALDPLDPLRVAADTHRLAFENRFVRVLDVHVPSGKTEPRHRHPHGMSVYFTDWDVKATVDGAQAEARHRTAGTFAWNDALVHTIENTGATEGHVLRIELKF
jgi:hypothetical protein